jgi:CRISPR-associated protein Csm2
MTERPRQRTSAAPINPKQSTVMDNTAKTQNIVDEIVNTIKGLNEGLEKYPIRELVNHAAVFGPHLKQQRLETNQVRKFLDAINQIKVKVAHAQDDEAIGEIQDKAENKKDEIRNSKLSEIEINEQLKSLQKEADDQKKKIIFSKIESDIILLKPKLAYAAARQRAAKPLEEVMSAAIDQVRSKEDFECLVQLIESIIAYHKAEGGK